MKLIPLEEENLPQEYFQHKLEIECMSGWEMSKLMHKINARCADSNHKGTIVWTSQYYVITLWFQKEKHKTWFELIR